MSWNSSSRRSWLSVVHVIDWTVPVSSEVMSWKRPGLSNDTIKSFTGISKNVNRKSTKLFITKSTFRFTNSASYYFLIQQSNFLVCWVTDMKDKMLHTEHLWIFGAELVE